MTSRARWLVLAGIAVVVVVVAWVAGREGGDPSAQDAGGSVRLGPDPGQSVREYRADLARQLPPPGQTVLALVQPTAQLDLDAATALAGPTPVETAVFRIPIPRVQTALRFEPVTGPLPGALRVARDRAAFAASADATRLTGRRHDVAAAERRAYDDPSCRYVLALVVRADRARLDALSADPSVRAVQAAPAGTRTRDLALAPLLPEQRTAADPLPDDGPVPPAPGP
ncbi:hypothetical protein [Pseudonocardia endophytica]|uniref:Uncharacterized protein n=1 Tax=Pseudonocardia endophytica TaxID=401976 RepID=A0A4R1HR15_PSEEN|nr:hypothetical protein [Pseudonocardia endophytica]TCK25017.1 hypothetical protein EV378_0814 [Pseudonocardia endophytica]